MTAVSKFYQNDDKDRQKVTCKWLLHFGHHVYVFFVYVVKQRC